MFHAKKALKSIPEDVEEEYEDYYAGERGSADSIHSESEELDDEESLLEVLSTFSLKDVATDLKKKYKDKMKENEPEDPIQKKITYFYRDTLNM